MRCASHGAIHSKINMWGKLGNVDGKFVELFNELSNARTPARYKAGHDISLQKGDDAVEITKAEIASLRSRIARFSNEP